MLCQYKKYRLAEFGRCPRTMCKQQPVVPVSVRYHHDEYLQHLKSGFTVAVAVAVSGAEVSTIISPG